MTTRELVDDFHEFAVEHLENGGADLSVDELYSLWKHRNPTDDELAESVAAVKAAYADFEAGDRGEPAREALRDSCRKLGLVIDE